LALLDKNKMILIRDSPTPDNALHYYAKAMNTSQSTVSPTMPGYNTVLTGDFPLFMILISPSCFGLFPKEPRGTQGWCPAAEQVFSVNSELWSLLQQIDTT